MGSIGMDAGKVWKTGGSYFMDLYNLPPSPIPGMDLVVVWAGNLHSPGEPDEKIVGGAIEPALASNDHDNYRYLYDRRNTDEKEIRRRI
jgi:hypothetical protein